MNYYKYVIVAFVMFTSFSVCAAENIALCGASYGYEYYAHRNLINKNDVGWEEGKISDGKITLTRDSNGIIDLLIADATGGIYSTVSEGGKVIPATMSDEAISVVIIYPNQLIETYVFQTLKDGKYQAMWTNTKVETMFPKISAMIAECSYLNLDVLKK